MTTMSKSERVFWPTVEVIESHHSVNQGFQGRGDIEFTGPFEFGGKWSGVFRSKDPNSHIVFTGSAEFSGSIVADRVTVEGTLNDVEVQAKIFHAKPGAKVFGRIQAERYRVDEGAMIQGRFVTSAAKNKK
jgi:cytoskeletal protein CcmA (bactofilin family)